MNLCATCGQNFGSVAAFDTHRVGNYLQTGTGECEEQLEDWTPEKGRRCLTVDELLASGSVSNGHGSWSKERDLRNAHKLNKSRRSRSNKASGGGGIRARKGSARMARVEGHSTVPNRSGSEYQEMGR